jgi:hypothetical protein
MLTTALGVALGGLVILLLASGEGAGCGLLLLAFLLLFWAFS